jgi:hypothetical protein
MIGLCKDCIALHGVHSRYGSFLDIYMGVGVQQWGSRTLHTRLGLEIKSLIVLYKHLVRNFDQAE